MKNRKPLDYAQSSDSIDAFSKKMGKLGFSFKVIGLPETLVLAANAYDPSVSDLTDDSIATIESYLEEKGADGGLITHLDSRENRGGSSTMLVTLLAYKLVPNLT